LNLPGFETLDRPARCLVTVLTMLSRLQHCDCISTLLFFAICDRNIASKTNTRSYGEEHNCINIKSKVPVHAMKEL
jgi:hypothetical protein